MIIATMPVSSSTIASELMIENQWIWSSPMYRYRSHRLAHLMSEYSHFTSYVKITSAVPCFGSSIGCGGRSGPTGTVKRLSDAMSVVNFPLYWCFTESGSTSNPTIREPTNDSSLWNLITKRRWLYRYGRPATDPGRSFEPMKPSG